MSPEFVEKLLNVNRAMGAITKDKKNKAQNYGYISADQIANKFRSACLEQGLVTTWRSEIEHQGEFEQNGKLKNRVIVRSTLHVQGDSNNDYVLSDGFGEGVDGGDKATMKAVTVSRKYAIMGLMQLAEGNDPEADGSTDEDARASAVLPRVVSALQSAEDKLAVADVVRRAGKYAFKGADLKEFEAAKKAALERVK